MNLRPYLSHVAIAIGVVLLSVGVQAFAFTQPSTAPPNGDAYAPLDTSANAQSKVSGLLLNTGAATNGLIVQYGKVGIDTASPGTALEVAGTIKAGTTPNPTWGDLIAGNLNTNIVYAYTNVCVGNSYGNCAGTGGVVISPASVKFPDGTVQTTAAVSPAGSYLPLAGGTMTSGANIGFNGGTTYGVKSQDLYIDTLNTGITGDPLEINYRTAGPVKVCASASCATYSAIFNTDQSISIGGNMSFAASNPSLSAPSYFVIPGGAYFNSGTVYAEAAIQARGGIHNDTGTNLIISGGTSGNTSFSGNIYAPIFYDSNNTGYYVDPNGNTNINALQTNNTLAGWPGYNGVAQSYGSYIWPGRNDGSGVSWQQSWYLASNSSWGLYTNTSMYSAGGFYDQGNRVYSASNIPNVSVFPNNAGYITSGGSVAYATSAGSLTSMNISQFTNDSGYQTSGGTVAALSQSGYYVNPASSSYINYLQVSNGSLLANWPGYNGITQTNGNYLWPGFVTGQGSGWNQSYYLAGSTSWGLYTNTSMYSAGGFYSPGFYVSSDESLKKNIVTVPDALDSILKLRGVEFTWKSDGAPSIGLIAQEVEKVYPQIVNTNAGTGLKSVEYANLVGPIIEAIKELAGKMADLAAAVGTLKDEMLLHEKQIGDLQATVAAEQKTIDELQSEVHLLVNKK